MRMTEEEYAAYMQSYGGEAIPVASASAVQLSEKAFMAAVLKLATAHGWKVFHPFDSRKSAPGYPDLTMAKPGQPVLFAELKLPREKPTIEQQAWLGTLKRALNTEVYLWTPEDWPWIHERLTTVGLGEGA